MDDLLTYNTTLTQGLADIPGGPDMEKQLIFDAFIRIPDVMCNILHIYDPQAMHEHPTVRESRVELSWPWRTTNIITQALQHKDLMAGLS